MHYKRRHLSPNDVLYLAMLGTHENWAGTLCTLNHYIVIVTRVGEIRPELDRPGPGTVQRRGLD